MRSVLVSLLLLVLLAGIASAGAYTQQDADACTPDAFRLCAAFIPDAGKIEACLRGNKRQLSPQCASVFAPKAAAAQQAKRALKRP